MSGHEVQCLCPGRAHELQRDHPNRCCVRMPTPAQAVVTGASCSRAQGEEVNMVKIWCTHPTTATTWVCPQHGNNAHECCDQASSKTYCTGCGRWL
jgi:hypothetical protein